MASPLKPRPLERLAASPFWPAFLSGLIAPGLGQIANREFKKGFFLLFASLGAFFWFSKILTEQISLVLPGTPDQWANNQAGFKKVVFDLIQKSPGTFLTFQILLIVVWTFGVTDAFLTARKRQRRAGPKEISKP